MAARVQIFYHDTVCYSQLVLGHFWWEGGSSRTMPTTNSSLVFVLVGMLAHGRLLINGLRSLNRLPTKRTIPPQYKHSFHLNWLAWWLNKKLFPLRFSTLHRHPHISIFNLAFQRKRAQIKSILFILLSFFLVIHPLILHLFFWLKFWLKTYSFGWHVQIGGQFVDVIAAKIRRLNELLFQRIHFGRRERDAGIPVTVT